MMESTPLTEQYRRCQQDEFRILVAGAGVAGISLAQMLRKSGFHPVLIEREADLSRSGYMLALMPMVDPLLENLEVMDVYEKQSIPFTHFALHGASGKRLRKDSIADVLKKFGAYRGISRGALLEVLSDGGCAVSFDTILTAVTYKEKFANVHLQSAGKMHAMDFDLIVVADGIHSGTRDLYIAPEALDTLDTGWGGWVAWAPVQKQINLGGELWAKDYFLGAYPVKGHLGVFLGGPRSRTREGKKAFIAYVRRHTPKRDPRFERCLVAVEQDPDPFFWTLKDVRSPQWRFKHTLLLGDAAAGFLPTAGIGAGMAMESAWVLARMLKYADSSNLSEVLDAYLSLQRPRVEAAQSNSRDLAKLMFKVSSFWAGLREIFARMLSLRQALRPIRRLLANPPDPDAYLRKRQISKENIS